MIRTRKRGSTIHRRLRTVAILFLGCAAVAHGQPGRKPASRPSALDVLGEVASFFNEYSTRVAANDFAWIKAHVMFPLPIEENTDDGTGDVARVKVKSPKDLVRRRGLLGQWSSAFWKRVWNSKNWAAARAGAQGACVGTDEGTYIDWTRGPNAFYVTGTSAEVVHFDAPCSNLADYNRFLVKKTPSGGWRLVGMKLGAPKR